MTISFLNPGEKLQTIMKVLTFCHDHRGKGLSLASSAGGSE